MPPRAVRPVRRAAARAAAPLPFDLLGRMSHELRTPLNAILGFSELMSAGMFGPLQNARYQQYVKLIHLSAANLLKTIDGLQRLIRLRDGTIALSTAAVDLDEAAHAALEAVSAAAAKRGILLRREAARRPVVVGADRELIVELLTELVRNAVSFTPDGGRVVVRVGADGEGARVEVIDTGVGVAASLRDQVMEPFVQLKPGGVPPHEGPGLGLAIAAAIAARHAGSLALEPAPGGGTRATLRLPMPKPSPATKKTKRKTQAQPALRTRSSAAKRGPSGRRSR
jgi:two-component system cell cycle sensor histidine kinase PleC